MAKKTNLMTPSTLKAYLDQYIIGQEEAKKTLCTAVYNHYKRIYNNSLNDDTDVEIDKSNIILLGNTGCGKTLLVKTIAKALNVPCYIQDCTKITASGYVGSDVEDCLVGLLRNCEYDVEKAQCGIVMLDEGDKIASKSLGMSIIRDVSGECVQQSLLKIVEGSIVGVPPEGGRKHPEQPLIYLDTTNILFILSGAFVGIDSIVKSRIGCGKIGFETEMPVDMSNVDSVNSLITPQDIRNFGFIPEFTGRFPIITYVNKLTEKDLLTILKEPKNSIVKQYERLLQFDNTKLIIEEDALKAIAKLAAQLGNGARGLRAIFETVMADIMYKSPENIGKKNPVKVTLTAEMVKTYTDKKYGVLTKLQNAV